MLSITLATNRMAYNSVWNTVACLLVISKQAPKFPFWTYTSWVSLRGKFWSIREAHHREKRKAHLYFGQHLSIWDSECESSLETSLLNCMLCSASAMKWISYAYSPTRSLNPYSRLPRIYRSNSAAVDVVLIAQVMSKPNIGLCIWLNVDVIVSLL